MLVLPLICATVWGLGELGEYHFYKNVGGTFYDYSGNGYHAVNGNSVTADANDVVHTDRGAYFDGVAGYVAIHDG